MSGIIGETQFVQIGTQKWERRNLDVITYRNGDPIPNITNNTEWSNLTTGAWCWYNNDPELGKIYGKLYNWYAVNDSRGLAPEGWTISSENDWNILISYLSQGAGSSVVGGMLKSTTLWTNPNTGATNSAKFNAIPGGWITSGFFNLQNNAYFWISTEFSSIAALYSMMSYDSNATSIGSVNKKVGMSIRCIKD